MNLADSDAMAVHLRRAGMQPTETREDADVIVLNTCTVRSQVELKAFAYIGRLKPLKEKKPTLKIIVAGCAAERLGEKLRKKFPFVDHVVGAKNIESFSKLVDSSQMTDDSNAGTPSTVNRHPSTAVSVFVTIMRGCDNFCSYCIVPHVRGRETSRSSEDILREAQALAKSGVKEITLLGQNVNSYKAEYGIRDTPLLDFSHREKSIHSWAPLEEYRKQIDFQGLLKLVSSIDGIERIRFTTNHPKDLSSALIEAIASTEKLCKHIHLPLQSGSDRILKAMNRGYTVADYLLLVTGLRKAIPSISLTTDIMVGFPGETEKDFNETVKLIETVAFNALFAYKYSPREGTAAFAFSDDIPRETKEARLDKVLKAANGISSKMNEGLLGTVFEVLVEKKEGTLCTSRTEGNTKVYFNTENTGITAGSFVNVKITEGRVTTLVGEEVNRIVEKSVTF